MPIKVLACFDPPFVDLKAAGILRLVNCRMACSWLMKVCRRVEGSSGVKISTKALTARNTGMRITSLVTAELKIGYDRYCTVMQEGATPQPKGYWHSLYMANVNSPFLFKRYMKIIHVLMNGINQEHHLFEIQLVLNRRP